MGRVQIGRPCLPLLVVSSTSWDFDRQRYGQESAVVVVRVSEQTVDVTDERNSRPHERRLSGVEPGGERDEVY